jgi:hypothetical protein
MTNRSRLRNLDIIGIPRAILITVLERDNLRPTATIPTITVITERGKNTNLEIIGVTMDIAPTVRWRQDNLPIFTNPTITTVTSSKYFFIAPETNCSAEETILTPIAITDRLEFKLLLTTEVPIAVVVITRNSETNLLIKGTPVDTTVVNLLVLRNLTLLGIPVATDSIVLKPVTNLKDTTTPIASAITSSKYCLIPAVNSSTETGIPPAKDIISRNPETSLVIIEVPIATDTTLRNLETSLVIIEVPIATDTTLRNPETSLVIIEVPIATESTVSGRLEIAIGKLGRCN